ncbi:helix-turn-helix domain-containing protein [Acidovorax cavernicola]|uniref:MarR family transcriptional regulator n=1 Tax=Acidovorax cavernicola TaxID=1675792 RepID=A0A9X8CZ04_9BURK|nr:helix-turn-helix domain-containing protein [Acidovorax cavernicola]RIX73010.1 MarR family transcriptional regulator [Acidovorax cavernicola]
MTGTRGSNSIRAVERALRLLAALNERPGMALKDLHQQLDLPKPTVHRLLSTLRELGYVATEGDGGVYRVTEKVREIGGGYTERNLVVDAGTPIALRVTRQIKWPLAIGTLDQDRIAVRYSTMPYSPLAVLATTVGHRLGLVESAMGLAYLSFCSETERHALLAALPHDTTTDDSPDPKVLSALQTTRRRGYGLRQPSRGEDSATVAVPIVCGDDVLGVLSMTTFGNSMTPAMLRQHVPILQETAREIAQAVEGKRLG